MTGTSWQHVHLRITGVVQGVGFRPFVHGLASELGLAGHVGNDAEGVFVAAGGPAPVVAEFVRRIRSDAPPMAVVDHVEVTEATAASTDGSPPPEFRIVESPGDPAATTATSIPPDTAVCRACLAELRDPGDRRFGYPFIACTHCGPRFTITTGLPYDRAQTTMVDFPLCQPCRAEYEDPGSRRFHAQPTACPDCGPRLSMPVSQVVEHLRAGRVVAIKGIGGYHLACDASDRAAVVRLRERKQRGDKPFAVMVPDLATAHRIAVLDGREQSLLISPARPIVLAASRDPVLQAAVAPGNGFVGVLLPYAPLHHLLFDAGAPEVLVMTSGNLADEPICIDAVEAEQRLADLADVFCHHDRRIHVPCDDSVVRIVAGTAQPVRRSRGYAPLPVRLPLAAPPIVAVGGELKATAAVASGTRAWLSQHLGDTEHLETLALLARSIATLASLEQVAPTAIVSDAHPGYLSHGWAARRAAELGVPHLVVQHHHAHLASLLAEHVMPPDEPVLGIVLDGTGYGGDGTIWGGELLVGSYASVRRVGHLRPVLLPGGDAAVRHPARVALAHLAAAGIDPAGTASAGALGEPELRVLGRMLATGSHCVPTTSAGRLFDAVASLLAVRHVVDYEAQAAIELEALAARAEAAHRQAGPGAATGPGSGPHPTGAPSFSRGDDLLPSQRERINRTGEGPEGGGVGPSRPTPQDTPLVLDPRPWIAAAVADHATGRDLGEAALAFHISLADGLARIVEQLRHAHAFGTVGLSGGVFANAVLTELCLERLDALGVRVLTHRLVPPNDGGLVLGQVAVAAAGGAHPA